MTCKKRLQNVKKKIFRFPCLRENCVEKNEKKFSNQLGDVTLTSVNLTKYRTCCWQVF